MALQRSFQEESDDTQDPHLWEEEDALRVDGIYIPPAIKPALSYDPTGPRLIITKITNSYFKSYGNNIELGPFHKCFNAIVGPNGSGKSNVIDSLLFVFGYRATKIRCKKISVLLHNSEHIRNVQSCRVAIHFAEIIDKDGDNYEIVPNSEFVVSRIANKDNSSYYEFNRRKVQFKEVGMLLKKHGIDLDHNRFLILQGEVEQIAMMKCKGEKDGESGMLEYLEDVIGTSRYKVPLEQVHERVEILTERRTEKQNRLKMIQTELDGLRDPMQEAVGFLKTENTVVKSKNFLYQKAIYKASKGIEVEKEKRDEQAEVQQHYIDKLNELNVEKQKHLDARHQEQKAYNSLTKKHESVKSILDKASKKHTEIQEEMINKNKTRKKVKLQIEEEKVKLKKLENTPQENEQRIKELEVLIKKGTDNKDNLEAQKKALMENIQSETQDLQAKKEELQKKLVVLKEDVEKKKSASDLADAELKMCRSSEEEERKKLEQLTKLQEKSAATIKERTKQIADIKKELPNHRATLNQANVELLHVKQEEANMIGPIRAKRLNLEESRNSMQSSKSRGRVVDALMQAKREGRCPGLYGRLGDLGAIDAKYDVAISTACGRLDNIVVDTVETAQWCIEFLKKHNVGRAGFIALDKQEHLWDRANSPIHTPENVHRLYDLVKVNDERVKTAFYFSLYDTLVANDLDQATRVAYGARRYRVVTLKGALIETSGTMSGGGRAQSGRMGQSVAVDKFDPKELQKLEKEVQQMESRIQELRQRQSALERTVIELQPLVMEMEGKLGKYQGELQSLQAQQPNLVKQIRDQEACSKVTKADAKEVKKLSAIAEERKKEYEASSEIAGELQGKVDRLSKEINDKTTGPIKAVVKKIKDCTKMIDTQQAEITRLRVAVKTAEKNFVKTQENIQQLEKTTVEIEDLIRSMKNQLDEVMEDIKKLQTREEELQEQLKEREDVYNATRKEVEEITKKETKLKSEKIEVDEKLKVINKKLAEINSVINSFASKLNQLQLQDIPLEEQEVLEKFTEEDFENRDEEEVERVMRGAENHLKVAKPNLTAIQEFRKKQAVFDERNRELLEVSTKRDQMRELFDDMRKRRNEEFISGYSIIKLKLKEVYQMITLGGDADLELVDSHDPFTEGVQFNVRPPKKTWKKISNLSGGEKTLSSLALVFALHYFKPSPLYVMDEIDAALDFKNVSIVGHYIKERTKNAQFVIISLRSNMFELCDNLVGIYKTDNTTKSITLNPKLYSDEAEPDKDNVGLSQSAPSFQEESRDNVSSSNVRSNVSEIVLIPESQEAMDTDDDDSHENDETIATTPNESDVSMASDASLGIPDSHINDSSIMPTPPSQPTSQNV